MGPAFIRSVRPGDSARLLEIYSCYVDHTAISFECAIPSLEEFAGHIKSVTQRGISPPYGVSRNRALPPVRL